MAPRVAPPAKSCDGMVVIVILVAAWTLRVPQSAPVLRADFICGAGWGQPRELGKTVSPAFGTP
jgi:hypothetical protein